MTVKLFLILLLTFISCLSAQQLDNNGSRLMCIPDSRENGTCLYTDINNPFELYRKLPDRNNPKAAAIKKLKFVKCYVDYFSAEMFTLFPNLEEIQAADSYLFRVDRNDIGKTETLKKFNISYNKIHRISESMGERMREVENIDLSHNYIERVMKNAFEYNTKLRYLNLSHNMIASLDRSFFDEVRSLHTLKLNDNRISEITGSFDHYLGIIQELYLQNNQIVTLDAQLIKNPAYLDVSFNKIRELNLKNARTIELKIVANELKNLTIGRKLQKLDASENRFYQFQINCDRDLNNLTDLSLSFIKYNLVDEKLWIDFRRFGKLRNLDLSDNNMITFDVKDVAFGISRSLEILNLNNSHVRTLKNWKNIQYFLPKLRELHIFDNIFNCEELNVMLPELQKLNISLPGYESSNNETFISRSCLRFKPSYVNDDQDESTFNHSALIWGFVILFMFGSIITGLILINKKLSIVEKISDVIKINPNKPRGSKLLDEEKGNDIENF